MLMPTLPDPGPMRMYDESRTIFKLLKEKTDGRKSIQELQRLKEDWEKYLEHTLGFMENPFSKRLSKRQRLYS
jgi:hypothetical protein